MISASRLERLAWKYRALAGLRARREELEATGATCFGEEEGRQRRLLFRRIARQFPGALRELDTFDAAGLLRRARDLDAARLGEPPAPWIPAVLDYHLTLRETLLVKRWLARRSPRGAALLPDDLESFAARMARLEALRRRIDLPGLDAGALPASPKAWAELAGRYLQPPGGRVLPLVWEALERRHGLPRARLQQLVHG